MSFTLTLACATATRWNPRARLVAAHQSGRAVPRLVGNGRDLAPARNLRHGASRGALVICDAAQGVGMVPRASTNWG